MKKLPIVNQTPRQMLVDHTSSKLRQWAGKVHPIGAGEPRTLISGLRDEDIRVDGFGFILHVSRRAVELAVSSVVDGAKPGTYAAAMASYADRMDEPGTGSFGRFVADVRRAVR